MSSVARLWQSGARDADQRVARMLAPRSLREAERYLQSSAVVRFLDRMTVQLESWWQASATGQTVAAIGELWSGEEWTGRYRVIGGVLLTAAATHITMTIIQGPRPGWYWTLIPGMVIVYAVLLLAGSRTAGATEKTVAAGGRIKVLALSPIPEEGAGCRLRVAQYI